MALWTYSLVVFWYAKWMCGRTELPFRTAPWCTTKIARSFADMLATLRRESWTVWISDQAGADRLDQKHLAPLLELAAYAAGP
jgi:hypothetical protein